MLITAGVILLITSGILWHADDRWMDFFISVAGKSLITGLALAGKASIAYGQFLQVIMQIEENTRKEKE